MKTFEIVLSSNTLVRVKVEAETREQAEDEALYGNPDIISQSDGEQEVVEVEEVK